MKIELNKIGARVIALLVIVLCGMTSIAQTTFNYTGAVQTYVVPAGVTSINISAAGAQGGGNGGGGLGAVMAGDFTVIPGEVLTIVVGQEGQLQIGGNTQNSSGGGGGSFVYNSSNVLLVAAGGGGGKCNYTGSPALHPAANGSITENGGASSDGNAGGTSGSAGNEGLWSGTPDAGGGAGWLSVSGGPYGGFNAPTWAGGSPFCGGGGGGCGGYGGFGGGGGGGNHYGGGGGGGGYSGGGGGTDPTHGGGGGSYSIGTNQSNTAGANTGNGQIIITVLCDGLTSSVSSFTICNLDELTLSAVSTNGGNVTWDLGVIDNVPFVVDSMGVVIYTATSDHADDCDFQAAITILELPDFTLSTGIDYGNNDGGVYMTLNSGSFPFTFDWNNDGTGDFDDPQNLVNLGPGTYTVVVMSGNGCKLADSATVVSHLSNEELQMLLQVYPNPTIDFVNITYPGQFTYNVTNLLGEIVFTGNGINAKKIAVDELAKGTYIITLYDGKTNFSSTFIKN